MTTDLLSLIYTAARESKHASRSSCTANGTTTTLVDARLRDQGIVTGFMSGAWILRPDAATADQVRRCTEDPFDPATGTLTVTRAWASAPTDEETYYLFTLAPPTDDEAAVSYSWQSAVNDALHDIYFEDWITMGASSGYHGQQWQVRRSETVNLAFLAVGGGSGTTITPPSAAWTLVRREDNGTDITLAVYRKRVLQQDEDQETWTLGASVPASIIIVPITGANPSSPVDAQAGGTGSGTAVTFPSATATQASDLVLRAVAAEEGVVVAPPNVDAVVADAVAWDGNAEVGDMVSAYQQGGSAAIAQQTGELGATSAWAAVTIALKTLEAMPVQSSWFGYGPGNQTPFIVAGQPAVSNNGAGSTELVAEMPSVVPSDLWYPTRRSIIGIRVTYPGGRAQDWDFNGRFKKILADGPNLAVELRPEPPQGAIVEMGVYRWYPSLPLLTSVTDCEEELAWRGARYKMMHFLNGGDDTTGQYGREVTMAKRDFADAYEPIKPDNRVTGI